MVQGLITRPRGRFVVGGGRGRAVFVDAVGAVRGFV